VFSGSNFKEYSCGGYRVISTSSDTSILTADIFFRRWNDMVSTYDLKPNQSIWIFQAGWDASLARDLQERVPEFHDLKSESFGRNISLFKLTTGQVGGARSRPPGGLNSATPSRPGSPHVSPACVLRAA
jgi:hypothetical protein